MLDRVLGASSVVRLLLTGAALLLVAAGWAVGLLPRNPQWAPIAAVGPDMRAAAGGFGIAWACIDAALQFARKRAATTAEARRAVVDEIRVVLEQESAAFGIPARPSLCSVVVWRVEAPTRRDRRSRETRAPLRAVYNSSSREHVSTGLAWREGMGVIGQCVKDNAPLVRDVEALWAPLRGAGQATWDAADSETRQGLTYDEFCRADHGGSVPGTTAPTVMAVPIAAAGKVLGCAALDVPQGMTGAVLQAHASLTRSLMTLGRDVLLPTREGGR